VTGALQWEARFDRLEDDLAARQAKAKNAAAENNFRPVLSFCESF
jgi:hypothetical protein